MTAHVRAAYAANTVTTASPAQLLVMLCERLVLDVRRGLEAQLADDVQGAHNQLTHAQDIVMELRTSLRPDGFRGGEELAALYTYVHRQLVLANIRNDAHITEQCLGLVTDLSDTWRQAALQSIPAKSA